MALADTLELLHILFVFLLLGALGMITYSSVMVARTDDVQRFAIYVSIGSVGGMISGASLLLVGLFGFLSAWEIGWKLTSGWLIASYITTGVALVVPAVTFKPWGEKAEKLMPQAISEGRILPEQKEILTGMKYRATEAFMYGLLIFIAYVMGPVPRPCRRAKKVYCPRISRSGGRAARPRRDRWKAAGCRFR